MTGKPADEIASTSLATPNVVPSLPVGHYRVPDRPLVVIEPQTSISFNLRDLWAYREVLYFLIWRDVKVRYKQAVFGVAWAIIQPLFLMFTFSFFFRRLVTIPADGLPYPIFVYAALVPWSFFTNAIVSSSNSLTSNVNLITKVYFPRLLIPAASIGAGLFDFAIATALLAVLLPVYGMGLRWTMLLYPALAALTALLALAVGIWMSALNAKYRDVRHALPFIIQLWMFATPIIYPLHIVPDEWRWAMLLNPMCGLVEGFRACLLGSGFDWLALAFAAVTTLVGLVSFTYLFRRMEDYFADFI